MIVKTFCTSYTRIKVYHKKDCRKFVRTFVNAISAFKSIFSSIVFSSSATEEGEFKNAEDSKRVHFLIKKCCAAKGKQTYTVFKQAQLRFANFIN
jgi:hypothetical protein